MFVLFCIIFVSMFVLLCIMCVLFCIILYCFCIMCVLYCINCVLLCIIFVFFASHYMAATYVEEPAGFYPPYIEKKIVYPELYDKDKLKR